MNREHLISAYERMCLIRAFEQRLDALFLSGSVAGTTHLCLGQEACAVGVCWELADTDVIFSNHRGHGHLLARGGDAGRLMAEILGAPNGYSGGRGGSQHVAVKAINFLGTHGITAGTIPLAVGAALHKKRTNEAGIAVVFFGEGATGEGVFHESLNMAAIWQLPVLFVCENNQYAMSSAHRDFSPVERVTQRAVAYAMAHDNVDGNDVEAVAAAVAGHRAQMIDNPHPVLLELNTYRLSGHSRGDQRVYRTREEENRAWKNDPLERTQSRLIADHQWTHADDAAVHTAIANQLEDAEQWARQLAPES